MEDKARIRGRLSVTETILSVLVLSGLVSQILGTNIQMVTIIITVLSLLAISISIYLNRLPKLDPPSKYLVRGDSLNFLVKRIMTVEAEFEDQIITDTELRSHLQNIEDNYKLLISNPLFIPDEDFQRAIEGIEAGQTKYKVDNDDENT